MMKWIGLGSAACGLLLWVAAAVSMIRHAPSTVVLVILGAVLLTLGMFLFVLSLDRDEHRGSLKMTVPGL